MLEEDNSKDDGKSSMLYTRFLDHDANNNSNNNIGAAITTGASAATATMSASEEEESSSQQQPHSSLTAAAATAKAKRKHFLFQLLTYFQLMFGHCGMYLTFSILSVTTNQILADLSLSKVEFGLMLTIARSVRLLPKFLFAGAIIDYFGGKWPYVFFALVLLFCISFQCY